MLTSTYKYVLYSVFTLKWEGVVKLLSSEWMLHLKKKKFFIPVRINVHKQFDVTHVPPFKVEHRGATVWRGWCGPMCE